MPGFSVFRQEPGEGDEAFAGTKGIYADPNYAKDAEVATFVFSRSLLYAGWSSAQQIPTPRSSTTPQIQLDVVVTPKSGSPVVANLEQQDFTVVDNKVAQPIKAFKAISAKQEPVNVILVVDAVNTSFTNIGYERGQISNFLKANGGHLAYPTKLAIRDRYRHQDVAGFLDGRQWNRRCLREVRHRSAEYHALDGSLWG